MTQYIRKLRAGRVANASANTWVGENGTIFYNETTGQLRIADGVTPGGHYVNLVVATSTVLGGIKAGPGANVSADGTLTINTAGLPLSFGDFSANVNILSTVNANEDMILASNGTGNVDLVGNVGFFTTATGPTGTPLFSVNNQGNVVVNGKLIVNGQSYFIGNETNFGNVVVNGVTTFNGATIINGDTTRTGNTIQSGNVNITGNSVNSGTSTFNGNTIFNGNVYHQGYTQFNGDTTHIGNIIITGQTTNNGLSIFNGNLTIAGNASLIGTTTVTGNTLVTGFTTVTGNTLVTGNTTVVGTATLTGNSYIAGNTFVTGTTTVIGNTYVTGQVTTITGNTYLQGNSFVTGTISITGNSVQTGLSTFVVSTVNTTQGAVEITGDSAAGYQAPINTGVMLQVTGQVNQPSRIYNDAQNNFPTYAGRRYNGNVTAPTQVLNNQDVVRLGGTGYTSGGWFGNGIARISLTANEDQALTNQGSRIELWVTPNGSNSSSITNAVTVTANLMTVNTSISAANVNVNSSGTLTTPRVVINDGGLRTINGGIWANVSFASDSMVLAYNPSGAGAVPFTVNLSNYVAGATVKLHIRVGATSRDINYGVVAGDNSSTGATSWNGNGGGSTDISNTALELVYTCYDGTAANTYVAVTHI